MKNCTDHVLSLLKFRPTHRCNDIWFWFTPTSSFYLPHIEESLSIHIKHKEFIFNILAPFRNRMSLILLNFQEQTPTLSLFDNILLKRKFLIEIYVLTFMAYKEIFCCQKFSCFPLILQKYDKSFLCYQLNNNLIDSFCCRVPWNKILESVLIYLDCSDLPPKDGSVSKHRSGKIRRLNKLWGNIETLR